jgi:N-acetylmuramoyl-L-alanine amidase/putative methionine-R-sulfoxide reductase with GAF domain
MATSPSKAQLELPGQAPGTAVSGWPRGANSPNGVPDAGGKQPNLVKPSRQDAFQALLAFSALHEQVRRRRAFASQQKNFDGGATPIEFEPGERFVLDEVLQLVAERAVTITGANGLAIALAENNEIVLRASAGTVKPDVGARIDRESAFSGACFRTAQIVRCDDTETDPRVNSRACRALGARSMVAVPLCGRKRVIGLLEAFSTDPFGFNDSDVRSLTLLAELVLGALKPEDEDRFAESAQAASTKLESAVSGQTTASPEESEKSSAPTSAVAPPVILETKPSPTPLEAPAPDPAPAKEAAFSTKSYEIFDSPENGTEENGVKENWFKDNGAIGNKDKSDPSPQEAVASSRRPGLLLVLALVVIFILVAAAIWWKIKNVQLDSAIAHSDKSTPHLGEIASQEIAHPSTATYSPTSDAIAQDSPTANAGNGDASDPNQQSANAANSQELAKFPHVTGIRHWSSSDSSTVVLDLQDQVQYEAHRLTSPDRIYFDLHDTALDPGLAGKVIDVEDALLTRVRVAQPAAGMTRVVLETKGNSNFSVSLEPNPYRLVVEVRKIGANPKGAVNLFPDANGAQKNELAIIVPPPTKEDLQLRARVPKMRIVVDAGHGGWDLGTVGRRGLLEKDVVLEIAQRLGKLLESRLGTEVLYTRQDDNYIPLDERAEIANQAQADLFVSVHANYSDLPSARGVETYYTNFFSAPSPKDLEMRSHSGNNRNIATAGLSPADLHERIEQSRRLAASVQRSLYGTLSVENPGLRDRGIKEAGFVVLTETAMPGILAEVSFVSSPTDEQRLRSDGYREEIAEALYKGIARYAAASHNVKVASAAK